MRVKDMLAPIEVKAVNGQAKSLRTLILSDRYPDISFGIKIIRGNIGIEGGIHYDKNSNL